MQIKEVSIPYKSCSIQFLVAFIKANELFQAFAVYICSIIIMLEVQIAGFIRVQIFIMSSLSLCPISKCMELFFGCSLFQIRTFERFSGPFSELTIGAEYVLVAYTHCSFSGVSLPFYIFLLSA